MWKYFPVVFFALLALLLFFRAPTNFLWKVSIFLTEFSWVPLLLIFLTAIIQGYFVPKDYFLLSANALVFLAFLFPTFLTYSASSKIKAEIQRQFGSKTGKKVMESPFSFWNSLSLSSPGKPYTEIVYQTVDGKDYTYRFFDANVQEKAPLVIVIHGGSWRNGDADEIPALNSYLSQRGVHVAAMNYRFAPKYKYPAQVEDVKRLVEQLKSRSDELKIDTTKIILLGRSAGGQIALQAAYGDLKNDIAGVISFYAPADMLWGAQQITNDWVLDVDKVLFDYIGCPVKECPEKYRMASAPDLVRADTPPTLLIHGKNDAMVAHEHAVRLMKKLKQFHVKSVLIELPFATHGCDYNFNGPSGQTSTYAIERFIWNLQIN